MMVPFLHTGYEFLYKCQGNSQSLDTQRVNLAEVVSEQARRKGLLPIDLDGLQKFLSEVVPSPDGKFCRVGFKGKDGKFKEIKGVPVRSLIGMYLLLQWWLKKGFEWSVFYTPWVRVEKDGKSFGVVRALVLDLDFPEFKEHKITGEGFTEREWWERWLALYNKSKEIIARAPVKPNGLVPTGNGAHLYFLLKEPWVEQGQDSGLVPLFNRLREMFGGEPLVDKRAHGENFNQLFRLPFTYNPKAGMFRVDWLTPDNAPDLGLRREPYTVEELQKLVGDYFGEKDTKDKEKEATRKAPSLDFEHSKSVKDYEKEAKKFLRMIKTDWRLRKIWFGFSSKVKRAKTGSEKSYVLARALLVRGFSPGFVLEMLRKYDFGIVVVSNRRGEMEKNPAVLEKRLKSIVKGAYKDTTFSDILAVAMEPGKYYSPGALAKRVHRRINDVKRVLAMWRSLGLVETKLVWRRGKKRRITLYRLTDEGLKYLKKRRVEKKEEPGERGTVEINRKERERLQRALKGYPLDDLRAFREYVSRKGVPSPVVREFEKHLRRLGVDRERGSPEWVDDLFLWLVAQFKRWSFSRFSTKKGGRNANKRERTAPD